AIEKGFIQQEIMEAAYEYQRAVDEGEEIVVGVNKFAEEEAAPEGLLRVDPAVGKLQEEKIKKLKEERDNDEVEKTLKALHDACETDENLMPYILDAVHAYATLQEICDEMRSVFGEY